jgi:hypothetical protein
MISAKILKRVAFGFVLLLVGFLTCCGTKKASKMNESISYTAIQKKYVILGKTGHPLGQFVRLEGQWKRREGITKGDPFYFVVTRFNGGDVQTAIEFDRNEIISSGEQEMPAVVENAVWELAGYETGGFFGIPPEILNVLKDPVQIGKPYSFEITLVVYEWHPKDVAH